MINQVILLGHLINDIKVVEDSNKEKYAIINLVIMSKFDNDDTDYVDCYAYGNVLDASNYCHKGDLVGIKGVVKRKKDEEMVIVAEKITFLSKENNV